METSTFDHVVVGTCTKMCSDHELKLREERELIHRLEFQDGTKRVDRSRAIKEYSRPAAGKSDPVPSELRPGPVLLRTVNYLINNTVPLTNHPWFFIYEFVFDRLRAVRQDTTIQRIHDNHAVHILERAVRVMVYAQYRLCECPPAQFAAKINSTHIQECLKRLLCLYAQSATCRCHQGEFVALYLMFNLGRPEALEYGLTKKKELSVCGTFTQALSISLAWWRRNYVRVSRMCTLLPVLHRCAANHARPTILRETLSVMCSAYHSKACAFPLPEMCRVLHIDHQRAAQDACDSLGLEGASVGGVKFTRGGVKDDGKVAPSRQRSIEEDLEWEDISSLLIGPKCQCISRNEFT